MENKKIKKILWIVIAVYVIAFFLPIYSVNLTDWDCSSYYAEATNLEFFYGTKYSGWDYHQCPSGPPINVTQLEQLNSQGSKIMELIGYEQIITGGFKFEPIPFFAFIYFLFLASLVAGTMNMGKNNKFQRNMAIAPYFFLTFLIIWFVLGPGAGFPYIVKKSIHAGGILIIMASAALIYINRKKKK